MTILPKKKGEGEKAEKHPPHAHAHNHGATERHSHTHTHSHTHERARRPPSPQRWLPPNNQSHDAVVNHNKRRHRSSPHRTVRKHRQTCAGPSTSSRGGHAAPAAPPRPAGSPPNPAGPPEPVPELSNTEAESELEAGYNSGDEYEPPKHPDNIQELEAWFERTMKEKRGLLIKKMGEDGACMFRAVADQVYGDQEMHGVVRQNCIDYMSKNADFFKHYVTEDFNEYLKRKCIDSAHGNHVEMQAISELYNRPVEVFQYSQEPTNIFQSSYRTDYDPIRISYHGNVHYNSLVDPYKATIGVGLGLPGYQPGLADKNLMKDATSTSENFHIEKQMLEDKLRETDWEVTQESIEEQVARESYLQWLKDNEKRAKKHTSPRSASATCSSAAALSDAASNSAAAWWDPQHPAGGAPPAPGALSPEPRTSRSPRQRSNNNSAHNSPNRTDHVMTDPAELHLSGNTSPTRPSTSSEGAVGGATFPETVSIMNELPPQVFGLCNEWEEDDILAQVMAQSQQEYLDSLRKKATVSSPAKRSSSGGEAPPAAPSTSSCSPAAPPNCDHPTASSLHISLEGSSGSGVCNSAGNIQQQQQ